MRKLKPMTPIYDSRTVLAHGDRLGASVYLMNEAPGKNETKSGITSFGQQGGNIFRALRKSGISWALAHEMFVWPQNGAAVQSQRHTNKAIFLDARAKHITCTNAFPRWPKPSADSSSFCAPLEADIATTENLSRIRGEICATHRVILVCGRCAYFACLGKKLTLPSKREGTELSEDEIVCLNNRLGSHFEKGWYMGHTRRWSMKSERIFSALKLLAKYVGWPLED